MLDINGPAHIFYEAADYGAGLQMKFISISGEAEAVSSAGLSFSKLSPFYQYKPTGDDFIFIPGLSFSLLTDLHFLEQSHPFLDWVTEAYQNGTNICSVCTGAFLLAETGLLNGKNCTTHWKYLSDFVQRYPKVSLIKNRLFVKQNRIYTSAGVASGIDLALYILEELYGARFAADIAKEVVIYFRRGEGDPQLSVFLQYRNHLDGRIHEAQDFMLQQLGSPFVLDDIAAHVNMSSRNLTRLFKKTIGITIGAYLDKLRVERAVHLLVERNKVEFVANQCGLKSSNQLRALLKKYRNMLPSELMTLT